MKHILLVFYAVLGLFLAGCGSRAGSEITHLPFKANEDDRWGMIGVDGKVLFENEFENEPSAVHNGIFFVKNADGLYEYYTAEAKPKQINNKAYLAAGAFIEDVAPVVEPEQPISFIHRDGTTAFVLDKYKNDRIVEVMNFSEGLAAFKTHKERHGYINTSGKVVIEPHYIEVKPFSEGRAIVINSDSTITVIDQRGEKQFNLKGKVGDINYGNYHDGLLVCVDDKNKDKEHPFGTVYFLNKKGEKVFSIPPKMVPNEFMHDHVICYQVTDDKGFAGVMNKEGKIVIRPKYDITALSSVEPYIEKDFICMGDKRKFGLIDFEDNILCPFEFDRILPFYDGRHAFARKGDYWQLIDKKGEKLSRTEYSTVSTPANDNQTLESDWFDAEAFTTELFKKISPTGFGTLKLGASLATTATQAGLKAEDRREYNDAIRFPESEFNEYCDIQTILVSKQTPVVLPITEQVYRGWWEGWQTKTVGYQFNARSNADQILLRISARWPFSKQNGTERLRRAIAEYLDTHKFEKTEWNDNVDAYQFPQDTTKKLIMLTKSEKIEDSGLELWIGPDPRKKLQ